MWDFITAAEIQVIQGFIAAPLLVPSLSPGPTGEEIGSPIETLLPSWIHLQLLLKLEDKVRPSSSKWLLVGPLVPATGKVTSIDL